VTLTDWLTECRYMVIVHPLRGRLSGAGALAVIAVIWVVSAVIASPNVVHADVYTWLDNVALARWTGDREVAGSTPCQVSTPGMLFTHMCLCHQAV